MKFGVMYSVANTLRTAIPMVNAIGMRHMQIRMKRRKPLHTKHSCDLSRGFIKYHETNYILFLCMASCHAQKHLIIVSPSGDMMAINKHSEGEPCIRSLSLSLNNKGGMDSIPPLFFLLFSIIFLTLE